ncbi:ABC transporter ATP-binding protein [Amycolatopsis antarctica]|uniref:ABC transporter ATP-binding protein n=1 Tax=Amycolatopsis antarctica TaxID=1854586 RepID=A0A263CYW7_9PSEU|nr:ATP-binding cassette domain-containing protein [Amycolatopsis antarctica]OZM71364.1 ABC transporter ATP-binding protein [Amycolatopsis antarctica]
MITARGLGVRAGRHWLFRELDLEVPPGSCLVVTGPNGTGKSTILRCLYGMQEPAEGMVTVGGRQPDERDRDFRRTVSALLDDSDFFAQFTPAQHVELLAASFGHRIPDIDAVLDDAGLGARSEVSAGGLSAGQRRRLLLVGATSRPFDVLLLDEPERALDVAGKEWITSVVARATGAGAAVVLATHHPPLLDVADAVLELAELPEDAELPEHEEQGA